MHICGAKFQEHCLIVLEILLILPFLSCKSYDIITDLICILEKCQYVWNKKRYFKKKNAILLNFERPFKSAGNIFHVIYTLNLIFTLRLRMPSASLVNCAPLLAITSPLIVFVTVAFTTHGSVISTRLTDSSWVLPARKSLGDVTR